MDSKSIFIVAFLILIKVLYGSGADSYRINQRYLDDDGELKFPEDIKQATNLLNDAYKKMETLEEKIMSLEGRMPKTYPDVHFLNYLGRKRILVSPLKFYYSFPFKKFFFLDNRWCRFCRISSCR